ncbi:telomere-associated protein Tap [Streptomyces hoynatensis]|uniref:Helix-turn-helix domain-containing protein n=1 Tax=Streptomyces hoynatensis TaxID=1141874 RepID=A0A3A9Z9E1_9ACTN|nr:helix-turn-helix domain-containing protein [Streptomyces hoynatensis]RKN44873.1 helix-turn-helix domain-containing protein [Streptomyces hoynatensis]
MSEAGPEATLFDAVDALVERRGALPAPPERARLRRAHGLSLEEVAAALRVRAATVRNWESGRSEPRPPQREAYARLLSRLAPLHPRDESATAPAVPAAADGPAAPPPAAPAGPAATPPASAPAPASAAPPVPATAPPAPAPPAGAAVPPARSAAAPAEEAARPEEAAVGPAKAAAGGAEEAAAVAGRPAPAERARAAAAGERGAFPAGPLAVLDGEGAAHLADGGRLACPAATVAQLAEWALAAGLGQERLHRAGRDADPLVVLTGPAAQRLGLPAELADRRGLRLPADHPVVRDLTAAGWRLTRRGFGPWARVYRPVEAHGTRRCVQLAVLPWDALDARAWAGAAELPPAELARVLGIYARRVLTPRGSTAVNGLELMTALRPPTRAVRTEEGGWVPGPVPGSLASPVDPAPPEAPAEHPVARGRAAGEVLDEEAYDWVRDPESLTDAECERSHVVGLDVNMAFAAAANRLTVGLGEPVHTDGPRFDRRLPACWLVDLSHVATDPRLPSPFTPTGERPTGPAWYATPTVAYAVELGYEVRPLEAWLRPESGPYLDPWYGRLRDAYLATMADLGVTRDLDEAGFLAAMARHRSADPGLAAVLTAIKATVKGGIGKLRERPQGRGYRPGERWPALDRPTWRPDIRAAVVSAARINMHRKMTRMAAAGRYPLAVLSDCVVYPSPGPSPLDVLPRDPATGGPLPGAFRLGVSPGMVKAEGSRPFLWAAELLDAGHNPARHLKDGEP